MLKTIITAIAMNTSVSIPLTIGTLIVANKEVSIRYNDGSYYHVPKFGTVKELVTYIQAIS